MGVLLGVRSKRSMQRKVLLLNHSTFMQQSVKHRFLPCLRSEDKSCFAFSDHKLDPVQNEIVHFTEAERIQFVETLAPLVNEQRALFGDELFRYLE